MSTNKHIDTVCTVVLLLVLLITGLFMNGEALGITPIVDGDAGGSQFTANDLNADWDSSNATQITLTGEGGNVKGNGAYISDGDVHILYAGEYILSGELTNGSVIIEADRSDKIWILLDGVSLHCDDNAAIRVEQAEKVFLTLAGGTENVISSGAEYTANAVSSGIDGAIYSRDDLTINGSGSLRVTAEYRHAIVCNDNLVITGGDIEITAAQDGIHANDSAKIADANITINAGDDGITVSNDKETAYIYIESGNISIPTCYEGIEAIDITIAGGEIDIRPTDDGINANGRGSNSVIRITGGDITIINETGRDADGLDSNGDIYISGGNLFISVTSNGGSCAIDYGSENGGVCEISGGTVIAAGSSTMAEGFDSSSEQCFIMYNTSTASAGTTVSLKNSTGTVLMSETIPCSFSSVVISTPELQMGETCTISIGDTEEEITVDNSSSSGMFGGGMFGGGMQSGGFWGGMFGGRGGRQDQSDGNALPQDMPEMSDGGDQPQDMFEMPGGGSQPQDMFEMPDGDGQPQGMFEMPDGDSQPQDMPEIPDGDGQPQDMFDMPDGGGQPQDIPEMSDRGSDRGAGRGGMFGNQEDLSDDMRTPNQGREQNRMGSPMSAVLPDTLILVGISVLCLLAGIFVALKVRH